MLINKQIDKSIIDDAMNIVLRMYAHAKLIMF